MTRRKRRKRQTKKSTAIPFELKPDTKRGIMVVLLFAMAVIMFLSFFQVAGSLGVWFNNLLSMFFGIDRYLIPIVIVLIGATFAYPDKGKLSTFNYIGLLFFFLSFNSTINLLLVNRPEPFTTDLSVAGGYLGQFLGTLLPNFIGYWGALVVVVALLFVSIMLIFNTSLRSVMVLHRHITGWIGERAHTKEEEWADEDDDEIDIENEDEEETTVENEKLEESTFRTTPVKNQARLETVLTTKNRRKVTIPMSLLEKSNSVARPGDIERNKEIISKTFSEFGIEVEMGGTSVGPTVTQFTLRPSQGIKISRIVGLQNDLALALAAHPIRMEAPIPGKSLVGIEVPNTKIATVTLRDVMDTKQFKQEAKGLTIPLGKDVSGQPIMIELDKMPHLLVAGATGSGKSVCLNTLILSLLYQNGPDDLKLILVDPKRVELTIYNGIPHLLVPPIINTDDTVNALKWTVREMERRLDVLSKFGARNIDAYNKRAEDRMPKIVVVIDELADLMSTNGREVEATIVRIAQMARAVGIHLVLATQRPSVDVITGLIKANIPGRIAFAVASQTDSRTILDCSGAEKLLGRGDMLFSCAELSKPKRIQGGYISTEEIEGVVSFLKQNGEPDYNLAVTEIMKAGTVFDDAGEDEPLFEEAVQIVISAGKASTSFLQRRLKIGYSRAARIIDIMQEAGVVSEGQGSKPREILIDSWPPGGNLTDGMPTTQRDYDEAYNKKDRFIDEDEEIEENDEDVEWEEIDNQEEVENNWEDENEEDIDEEVGGELEEEEEEEEEEVEDDEIDEVEEMGDQDDESSLKAGSGKAGHEIDDGWL